MRAGTKQGRDVFVNFRYPRRASDLTRDLEALRRAREARP
jgi:hypothetical protein